MYLTIVNFYFCAMRNKFFFWLGVIPLFFFSSMYFYACATEHTITLHEVPTAVLNAFKEKHPSLLLADWTVMQRHHKTVYEASWKLGVRTHHDFFDEDGNFIKTN